MFNGRRSRNCAGKRTSQQPNKQPTEHTLDGGIENRTQIIVRWRAHERSIMESEATAAVRREPRQRNCQRQRRLAPATGLADGLMSLLPLGLRFFHTLGYSSCHGLNRALCPLGQITDRVRGNWNLLCRRISGDRPHEAEQTHDATDEKERHPDKAAPKQTRRAATTEG